MGLDNIPKEYPCVQAGIAIMTPADDDGNQHIDCNATREAGQCPHAIHFNDQPGIALGIFGTPCWYRGKYGNALLMTAATPDDQPPTDFYGDDDTVTPELSQALADWMRARAEKFMKGLEAEIADQSAAEAKETRARAYEDFKYAADWLEWSGKNCGGSVAWW